MFEPTEHEVDEDVERSMEIFRRAQVGEVAAVEPIRPKRLLLALDASSQDQISIALAAGLRQRFAASLDVMDGRENVPSNELAESVAEALKGHPLPKTPGDSHEQILAAVDQTSCDLVIVPCPFARDLEKLGSDSTGTVVDVLLSRSAAPILIVREKFPRQDAPFAHVLMVLIGDSQAAPLAARWASGLVMTSGKLELLLVLEEEVFQSVRELMRWLEPNVEINAEKLAEALARSQLRLHHALQKTAAAGGFEYQLVLRREIETRLAELTGGALHPLLVLALQREDRVARGHVDDRIRHSPHPLLVVPHG